MSELTSSALLSLIATIADRLGHITDAAVDDVVEEALASMGRITHADRCYLFRFSPDASHVSGTHEWTQEGIAGSIEPLVDLEVAAFPESLGRLQAGETVEVPRVADVPPSMAKERAIWEGEGNRSMLAIPVLSAGRAVAAVGLDWVRAEHAWTDEHVELLRVTGSLLVGAIRRRDDAAVQREALRALEAADLRFRSFLTQTRDALFCWEYEPPIPVDLPVEEQADRMFEARLVECNDAIALAYGAEDADAIRGALFADIKALSRDDFHPLFMDFVRAGYRTQEYEVSETMPDGTVVHYVNSAYGVVEDGHLVRTWGSFRNVTEMHERRARERELEQQLHRAQRMESVGRLAGGVAHDFNNMLMAVLTYTDLARQSLQDAPTPVRAYLDEIHRAGERASNLTRQLLSFSRRQALQVRVVSLDDLIDDLAGMLATVLPETIRFEVSGGLKGWCVDGDPGLLEQVVVNLCVNARDAMPGGGQLRLSTRLVDEEGEPRALLSVQDEGMGIEADVIPKLFEPFFTTKAAGQGTGLGLYVAHGIVQRHGGELRVHSEVGQGTRFDVLLPCRRLPADDASERPPQTLPRGGSERLLLIEDEALVRRVVQRVLEGAGYDVVTAADGVEGQALFLSSPDDYRLVVLDAVLPKCTGFEVWQAIHERSPELPVLFMSGYDRDQFPEDFFRDAGRELLRKPFPFNVLLERVRAMIDSAR